MSASFTINAPSGTDIWRKPPTTDVFNAPRAPPSASAAAAAATHATGTASLSSFRSAKLSFLLHPTEQYDQAGLVLSLHARGATHPFSAKSPPKWIKTGVEYYNGEPKAATVACDAWADWSLGPVAAAAAAAAADVPKWVTVLVEVSGNQESGRGLWVYQLVEEGGQEKKVPLREICWVFGSQTDEWDITVEAYACRPAKEKVDLQVEFRDFEVVWA